MNMQAKIIDLLRKELVNIEDFILLVETATGNALDLHLAAVKVLSEKGIYLILLSVTRPYSNLLKLYQENKIDTTKIFILDTVSKGRDAKAKVGEKVICVADPSSLTEISIEITKCFGKVNSDKVVFIESLPTLLIHNKPDTFEMFVHSLLTKMRINKVGGLLISFEDEKNRGVIDEIAQLCDKTIKI